MEGTELYSQLQTALFKYAEGKGELQSRRETLEKLYANVEGANIDGELTADLVGDYIFTDADFLRNLSTNHRNVFEKIFDEVKYLYKVATAGSKEARELEKIKKTFEKVYRETDAQKNTAESGGTKYSIVALDNGNVYVKASRNVIKGKTRKEQRRDITKFFSNLLERQPSLDIHTIGGDILTITKRDTAWKAKDDYKSVSGYPVKLTDEEFAVKLRVEAHIDEIVETSSQRGYSPDSKGHSFAKNGFTYHRAYFEDFDGQYYEITFSVGHKGTVATVYNVGKIKASVTPSAKIIAVVGSKPLGGTPANNIIPQNNQNVNSQNSLSAENEDLPTHGYRISGKDVALDEPLPLRESSSVSNEAAAEDSETLYTQEERSKRLERKLQRIDKRLEREKEDLKAEFENRRQTMEESLGDKNDFVSNRASELYEELRNLKKGIRASESLGYLLDHGYPWSDVKTALLNINNRPGALREPCPGHPFTPAPFDSCNLFR